MAMAWHFRLSGILSLRKHSKVYLNISILDMAFLFINPLKQFSGKTHSIRYIRKTKAYSLVSRRIVAPVPSLATLVLRMGLAYVRNNYNYVILKHIDKTS